MADAYMVQLTKVYVMLLLLRTFHVEAGLISQDGRKEYIVMVLLVS